MIVLHAHHTDITSACGIVLCAYADFLHVLSQALLKFWYLSALWACACLCTFHAAFLHDIVVGGRHKKSMVGLSLVSVALLRHYKMPMPEV